MAISDDERRKVASRLREEADNWKRSTIGERINLASSPAIWRDMMHRVGMDGVQQASDMYKRLADLIDRQTTIIEANKHGRACCANCGCDDWCLADGSNFCPNCGRQVVRRG